MTENVNQKQNYKSTIWTDCKKCGTSKNTNQYRVKGKDGSVFKCIDPHFCVECIAKLRKKHPELIYNAWNKFIDVLQTKEHEKTNEYTVYNKKSNDVLGVIKWYPVWRQYCFFPWYSTIFNKDCLRFITHYMDVLMEERKCLEKK